MMQLKNALHTIPLCRTESQKSKELASMWKIHSMSLRIDCVAVRCQVEVSMTWIADYIVELWILIISDASLLLFSSFLEFVSVRFFYEIKTMTCMIFLDLLKWLESIERMKYSQTYTYDNWVGHIETIEYATWNYLLITYCFHCCQEMFLLLLMLYLLTRDSMRSCYCCCFASSV